MSFWTISSYGLGVAAATFWAGWRWRGRQDVVAPAVRPRVVGVSVDRQQLERLSARLHSKIISDKPPKDAA